MNDDLTRGGALNLMLTAAMAAVAAGCGPKEVDIATSYPKVGEAMNELFRAVGSLQACVGVLDQETWRAMLPEVKRSTLKVSMAASSLGMKLRFPT